MWQDEDGKLMCARLANEDSQRFLEDRVWSWVSRMSGGKILLQSADGMLWKALLTLTDGIAWKQSIHVPSNRYLLTGQAMDGGFYPSKEVFIA